MSYTKALYYPTIDIDDSEWIKNAILFWDEIDTIVPEAISSPYKNNDSRFLYDEGILKPLRLSPHDSILMNLQQEFLNFSETEPALDFFRKMDNVSEGPTDDSHSEFYLHLGKLPYIIQGQLRKAMDIGCNEWIKVSYNFADYYMTLLATKLAKRKHMCLVTGYNKPYELSASFDFNLSSFDKQKIAEGILFKMVVNGIRISRTASMIDLIAYKRKRRDELGRFRSAFAKLTDQQNYDSVESLTELEERVRCIYENDYLPALHDVKWTLNDSKISWLDKLGNYIATFFTPSLVMDKISVLSCGIGLGVSLLAWKTSNYIESRKVKHSNPYSYLLSLNEDGYIAGQ